jgi:hypothetical protein
MIWDWARAEPIATIAPTRTGAKYRKNRDARIPCTVAETAAFAM